MSATAYLILGVILSAAGTLFLTIGISALRRSEEAYSLSVPPSLEIRVVPDGKEKQKFIFENTGQHTLINLEAYYIEYRIEPKARKLLMRIADREPVRAADQLEPKEKVEFPFDKFGSRIIKDEDPTPQRAASVIVIYRRKADNKRYVEIEPYSLMRTEYYSSFSPFYGDRGSGSTGTPSDLMDLMKEIIDTEKTIFRAD